tara:strand:+ start:3469 stop:4224 length:756 start_codon:yes stop_codon:yes gene_type:complete
MNTSLGKILLIFFICSSCATKKDLYYFQDIDNLSFENSYEYLKIQPGDILDIQIKAINPESVLIFQKQSALIQQNIQFQNRAIDGYLVGDDNSINLPLIGSISTFGLNTSSLSDEIVKKLIPYIKDPSVNVRILNFRVSVLGEVNRPGTYTFLEERVSIPQALGQAGDLTINGDRNNVLLIRDLDGNKSSEFIDLTKSDFVKSSNYYLKQNDILYIRPNNAKIKSAGLVGNTNTLVSILSLAVSLFIVITR